MEIASSQEHNSLEYFVNKQIPIINTLIDDLGYVIRKNSVSIASVMKGPDYIVVRKGIRGIFQQMRGYSGHFCPAEIYLGEDKCVIVGDKKLLPYIKPFAATLEKVANESIEFIGD